MNPIFFIITLAILLSSCSSPEETEKERMRRLNQKGEYLYRSERDAVLFNIPTPTKVTRAAYPWEAGMNETHSRITKEFFRCKGSQINPVRTVKGKGDELTRYYDCGGTSKHSLPLRNEKEFIYPILIDLLNYIQLKTGKRVVITCGHRCPEHNNYADPSIANQSSKHMIGAEVSFYVQGMENRPEAIVEHILNYYKETSKYKGKKEFEFQRHEKNDTNVSTQPWYNQEIFVKLFNKKEGRDFDNRHPYAYLSIQVRYDMDLHEKVIYSWEKAHHHYLRW
jgi:hypothetical protein